MRSDRGGEERESHGLSRGADSGRRDDRDVSDEIEFHLAQQAADLESAGWTPEAARTEAGRRFGNAGTVASILHGIARRRRGRIRRAALIDEARSQFAFALRQMRKRPGFAATAVLLLGVGFGLASATFAIADAALLRPLPFGEPERLVYLQDVQEEDDVGYPASLPELRDWTDGAEFLTEIAGVSGNSMVLGGDEPTEVNVGWVAGDWVGVLGLSMVAGRGFTPEELAAKSAVVLLDETAWRERWSADPDVVGSTVLLDDEPHTVIGVLSSRARVLAVRSQVAVWVIMPELELMTRGLHFLRVVGRLRDGVTLEQARVAAEALSESLESEGVTDHGMRLVPARDLLLGNSRTAVGILSGAALLVLLVVCVNLAILFAARAHERLAEFAVRGALGAARGRIVRQVVTETLTLGVVAGVVGVASGRLLIGFLARTQSSTLAAVVPGGEARAFWFTSLLALLAGLLVGLGAAGSATGSSPARVLGVAAIGRRGRPLSRRALVSVEVALSVVLLVSAGLLLRSVDRLLDTNPGFDASDALTAWVTLPASRYREGSARVELWNGFLERVRALPGVQAAGVMNEVPLGGGDTNGGFEIVGREFPDGNEPNVKKRFAGPGAFEALGVPLLRGRSFLVSDAVGSPEVAVVSRSFAERWWPGGDPIGQRIRFLWHTEGEQEIVGVVEDVRSEALDLAELGTVYLSYVQIPAAAPAMSVIVRTAGDPLELAEAVRGALQSIDRALPLSGVTTLEALVSQSISNRTRVMGLLTAFAGVALALAALGLYAVTARAVGARSREIGIRKAMGAERASIIGMVLREEGPAVLLGLLVGLAASVPATRALGGLLYATQAGDPTTLVAVTLTLGTAALAALLAASWRAARTPPALAVRS